MWALRNFRRLRRVDVAIAAFAVTLTLVYLVLDYRESPRMRFEVEPFWWLLCWQACDATIRKFHSVRVATEGEVPRPS